MKKNYLYLALIIMISILSACNDNNNINQNEDSKDYILLGDHSPTKSSFGILINGGEEENGLYPYMLVLGGGVSMTEYVSLTIGMTSNVPNDMAIINLLVCSNSPNSIPSGTYTYKDSDDMLPFSIHVGIASFIAKGYEYYPEDEKPSEHFGEYELVSATMEVKNENNIYDIAIVDRKSVV